MTEERYEDKIFRATTSVDAKQKGNRIVRENTMT